MAATSHPKTLSGQTSSSTLARGAGRCWKVLSAVTRPCHTHSDLRRTACAASAARSRIHSTAHITAAPSASGWAAHLDESPPPLSVTSPGRPGPQHQHLDSLPTRSGRRDLGSTMWLCCSSGSSVLCPGSTPADGVAVDEDWDRDG